MFKGFYAVLIQEFFFHFGNGFNEEIIKVILYLVLNPRAFVF